jgi:hypothetical protein
MVQLAATRCSCIAILWVSLLSFAVIALCVASQRVFIVDVYFVIDSVQKLLDVPSYFVPCFLLRLTQFNFPLLSMCKCIPFTRLNFMEEWEWSLWLHYQQIFWNCIVNWYRCQLCKNFFQDTYYLKFCFLLKVIFFYARCNRYRFFHVGGRIQKFPDWVDKETIRLQP